MAKKIISMAMILMCCLLPGCNKSSKELSESSGKEPSVIRVASLNKEITLPFFYIREKGWDLENGFKIDLSVYAGGALVNEALGAKLWDVSALGAAGVMSMAKYDCVQIYAHQEMSTGVNAMVRPDSNILSVKGYNPKYPEVYGSPDTVKGKTILVSIGSGNHMQISNWLHIIDLTDNDVNMVHMEFAQGWQAFKSGSGDVYASSFPYTLYGEEMGFVAASTFNTMDIIYGNNILCTKDFYENHKDLLAVLLRQIIRACDDFQNIDLTAEWMIKWYKVNGQEVSIQDARTQMEVQPFFGTKVARSSSFDAGDIIRVQAEFFKSIGNITDQELEQIESNIKRDILDDALAGMP